MTFITVIDLLVKAGAVNVPDILAAAFEIAARLLLTVQKHLHPQKVGGGDAVFVPPLLPQIHPGRDFLAVRPDEEACEINANGCFMSDDVLERIPLVGDDEIGQALQVGQGGFCAVAGGGRKFDTVVVHRFSRYSLLFKLRVRENLHEGGDAVFFIVADFHHGVIAVCFGKERFWGGLDLLGLQGVDKDLFLGGGVFHGVDGIHAGFRHGFSVVALTQLGHHVQARRTHGGLGGCQQAADTIGQRLVGLLHQQFHGVPTEIVIAQAEHILDLPVFRRGQFQFLCPLKGGASGVFGFVLQAVDDGLTDGGSLLALGHHSEHLVSVPDVTVGNMGAETVNAILVAQHDGDDHGPFDQVGPLEFGGMPGKDAGRELQCFLLHGAVGFHQPVTEFLRLGPGLEVIIQLGCMEITFHISCQHGGVWHKIGQIHRQNVVMLPVGSQRIFRRHMACQGMFQGGDEITGGQHLMVGACLDDAVQHGAALCEIFVGGAPEGDVDGHGILGLDALLPVGRVRKTPAGRFQILVADAVQVPGLLGHQSHPGSHRPLDGGIADEIMFQNGGEDGPECLHRTIVRHLADGLPQTLLEPCGQQKAAEKLMHPGIVAHDHGLDQFVGDCRKFTVAVDNIRDDLLKLRIILVQFIGQDLRDEAMPVILPGFQVGSGIRGKIARENVTEVFIQAVGVLE